MPLDLSLDENKIWTFVSVALDSQGIKIPEGFNFPSIDAKDAVQKKQIIEAVIEILTRYHCGSLMNFVFQSLFS